MREERTCSVVVLTETKAKTPFWAQVRREACGGVRAAIVTCKVAKATHMYVLTVCMWLPSNITVMLAWQCSIMVCVYGFGQP